ncbi:MAG: LysM peptidoglycan-binding domain-containing protein [Chloroflexota bacterium]|nr:LysM peptidoglycan-binding domain-containing protein [Chloroflexota bacterium]
MEEHLSAQPSPRPQRRLVRRARSLPMPPTYVWVILGTLVVTLGIWSLRPRDATSDDTSTPPTRLLESNAATSFFQLTEDATEVSTSSAALGAQPSLESSELVIRKEEVLPHGNAVVGHPQLVPIELEGGGEVPDSYTVAVGDTLGSIATHFGVMVEDLMALNQLDNPNMLYVGQVLAMPARGGLAAPFQRLLPDSELILSPAYKDFDIHAFVAQQGGYLSSYSENVEGVERSGVDIVEMVSQRYSVGPRPLLAMLEYESGWVTQAEPSELDVPLGVQEAIPPGLFFQLSWAANRMNEGYYDVYLGRTTQLVFKDGTHALYDRETNPGTAAIQNVFARKGDPASWSGALSEDGYFATYVQLFGDPWEYVLPSLIPDDLSQPILSLPWPSGETWYYTGGPHGGWGDLSGWAALDFVPPDNTGCHPSAYWATAAADGKIIRSEDGEVVLDLDGDGFVGTGWTLLYMHVASMGRVEVGTDVEVGDPIGRPSCEGGFSDATHLHIARRYNGQWIGAGGSIPFVMDGWQAQTTSQSYNGYLLRGEEQREACACRLDEFNGITAP